MRLPKFLLPALTLALLIDELTLPARALTVRVESPDGAPRIVVDGKPVRARMFFGGPGASSLPIGPEWKPIEFDFTASGSAQNGTMHFRFGPAAGDVYLDDIEVTDTTDGRALVPRSNFEGGQATFDRDWTHWPTDATNTVGTITVDAQAAHESGAGLHVKIVEPPDGHWPDFHIYHRTNLGVVEGHRYHVRLWARAVPARGMLVEFHRPGKPYVHIGGPSDPFGAQIKMAAAVGVHFISFPVSLPWPQPGEEASWEAVDAACRNVLSADPQALLVPRIPMDPPDWWQAAHPDEVMQWENGQRSHAVVASPLYRREAAARLAAFVAHLEEKFGDHAAGYHPVGQNTGEWFYENTWKQPLNGYAPADAREFRAWLRAHYGAVEALRAAWHDASVSFETAAVPSAKARHAAPNGVFRDPATEQAIIDWGAFQQDAMATCVCELAHAAREASHGKKLVLFFYGYVHELAGVMNGPATSGHFDLRQILQSPDIDIVCSPIAYFDRGLGGSAPCMSAAESVALAGKMWLNEDDTHTYLATGTPPGYREHVTTLEATNAELTRNVAEEALRNFATWWMDLTMTGWFRDEGMWREMARLKPLDDAMLATPTPFRPEIAAIVDERVMPRVAAGAQEVVRPCVYESRAQLARVGAPYGQYLLDDVLAGKVHAKLYVFLNAWSLSAAERARLHEATRGAVCIWCYAPGYFEDGHESPTAMSDLTGVQLQPAAAGQKAWAHPSPTGAAAGLQQPFGFKKSARPLLTAAHADDKDVLYRYEDGSAAVAWAAAPDGHATSLFVGVPGLTTELVRLAARRAGVHLFTETDCNVYANGPFVALHGAKDGEVTLDFGHAGIITDMLSGEKVGEGPRITLPLRFGQTRILKCEHSNRR